MAYETETAPKSVGNRIAGALTGALRGFSDVVTLQNQRKQLEDNHSLAVAHMKEIDQHGQELAEKRSQTGLSLLGQHLASAAAFSKPEVYFDANADSITNATKMSNNVLTKEQFVAATNMTKELAGDAPKVAQDAQGVLGTLDPTHPGVEKDFQKNYSTGVQAYGKWINATPLSARQMIMDMRTQFDKSATDFRDRMINYQLKQQEIAAMKEKQSTKAGDKADTEFNKAVDDFANYAPNKALVENIQKDKQVTTLLSGVDPKNPDSVNNFAQELAKRLVVKASVGGAERITEQMLANMNLNPSLKKEMQKLIARKVDNIALPADVTTLRKISDAINSTNESMLKQNAEGFAKGRKGVDTKELHSAIKKRFLLEDSSNSGPAVGDVVKGYEFLGGDPSKPDSWKKK